MSPRRTMALLVLAVLAFAGCNDWDLTPVCVPASTAACSCPTGAPGEKVCEANGLEYGDCACLPDAGPTDGSDAGVDAPVPSAD